MSHDLADLVAPLDALLLKGDADPSTRAIMSSVLLLDAVPDAAALDEAFERASYAVPRMRQRVTETGWTRALQQVPSRLATLALGAYARRVDLQASNIIGPDCALYLVGTRVERFYAFGPLPGIPIMAVMVSHDGTCTVGFTIDPASVTDPDVFLESVAGAFAELGVEVAGPDDAV